MQLAGLLTYSLTGTPSRPGDAGTVANDCSGFLKGLTAAGTISDFHTIPYYSFCFSKKNQLRRKDKNCILN